MVVPIFEKGCVLIIGESHSSDSWEKPMPGFWRRASVQWSNMGFRMYVDSGQLCEVLRVCFLGLHLLYGFGEGLLLCTSSFVVGDIEGVQVIGFASTWNLGMSAT